MNPENFNEPVTRNPKHATRNSQHATRNTQLATRNTQLATRLLNEIYLDNL